MNNIHMIGTSRKAGRRRERPIPGVALAEVKAMNASPKPSPVDDRNRSSIHIDIEGDQIIIAPMKLAKHQSICMAAALLQMAMYCLEPML